MLLLELFEAGAKHVTFCFGRMNPPTIGHKQVLDTMKSQGGDMRIFVSQTQDKKKNPLDYATKIKFIKEMFPEYAGNIVDNAGLNTIGKVASYLHEQGYNSATFVAGSDRLEDMKNLLTQYNGVEGKAHGFYDFEVLDFVSSGEREDGAEGVAGVSASGARLAAANNDFTAFKEATGAGELAKPLFSAVRKGMGIKGEVAEDISRRGFLRGIGAAAAGVGAADTAQAQISGEDTLPDIVAHVRFKVNGKEITKDINLGTTYKSPREAGEALDKFMKSKGIKYFEYDLERVKPKDQVKEAPIEMDPADPMDPMIHSHDKANPAKLKYRMLRAAGQLKDLAARAENASPGEWQIMARQFDELKMNMEQIRHALEELGRIKRKGGVRSRGITV
jgi:predicted heme/steroid binding protein